MKQSSGAVIAVFESHPYWGPELQRQFLHTDVTIRECRSVNNLFPMIEGFDRALFVIDLESGLVECLDWLATTVSRKPGEYAMIAFGSSDTADLEWVLREAGVTAFLPDKIPGDDLARLCRRQLGMTHRKPVINSR